MDRRYNRQHYQPRGNGIAQYGGNLQRYQQECISEIYQNVYFRGGDISSVFAPDVEYCQLACTFNPRCLMFSYLPASWHAQNERFACFLKDSVTSILPKMTLAGAISGHSLKQCSTKISVCHDKIFTGIDMIGTNYNITTVTNVQQCKEQCTNDIHCQYYTYVTEAFHSVQLRNKCYFKYSTKGMPTRIRNLDNIISGFSLKSCGKSSLGCKTDLFRGMIFYGENLTSVFAPDVHTCQKICTYYPNCLFFTFLTKEWKEPLQRNLCYIKTSKSGLPEDGILQDHTISGFSLLTCKFSPSVCPLPVHQDVDFLGEDLLVEDANGEKDCQQLCTNNIRCQFFTYRPLQSSCAQNKCKCHLKISNSGLPTGIQHGRGGISGFSLRLCKTKTATGCGQPIELGSRIVGGMNSSIGEWPWQVTMQLKLTASYKRHTCGGSIISNHWIATAAHCVVQFHLPQMWAIYTGIVKLSDITPSTPFFEIEQIIIHPLYIGAANGSDIALLKLKTPIPFNENQQAICLPPKKTELVIPNTCWITGWGFREESGSPENILQKAEVPPMSTDECQSNYKLSKISSKVLCAGYKHGKIDSCKGDSGGPLACEIDKTWYLVGITSWGEGCARPGKPGVYTRVFEFLDWIHEQTKMNQA
ncbi:plasma kallikrein [Rhinophrynus dorsalis]